jgi:hypothetical protein
MNKESKGGGFEFQMNFRCTRKAAEEFLRHVEAVGWTKDNVLRQLVDSANVLFAGKKRPVWPLAVIDALDDDGAPLASRTAIDELKAFNTSLAAEHLREVRAMTEELKMCFSEKDGEARAALDLMRLHEAANHKKQQQPPQPPRRSRKKQRGLSSVQQ